MYGYNEKKAGQVAAYFSLRAGGRINILKLAKLLYLAERESMRAYDEPMFFDKLVSMDHGPVTSISLNLVNGLQDSDVWPEYIEGRSGNVVLASKTASLGALDELSKADLIVLDSLWAEFSSFDQFQIRDWTHENCKEWEDPRGSSEPIPHGRVFKFLGKVNAEALSDAVRAYRTVSKSLEAAQ
jgi:uncharacterized phage-associated protein